MPKQIMCFLVPTQMRFKTIHRISIPLINQIQFLHTSPQKKQIAVKAPFITDTALQESRTVT